MTGPIEQCFHDIEGLYAAEVGDGWEGERVQLSRGPLGLRVRIAALPNIQIHWYWTQAAMHLRECMFAGGLFLTFFVSAGGDPSLFGRPFDPGEKGVVYVPGAEIDGVLPPEVETVGFLLSPVLRDRLGLAAGLPLFIRLDPKMMRRVTLRARRIMGWLAHSPFPDPALLRVVEERLAGDLARMIRPEAEPLPLADRRSMAVRRALEALRLNVTGDLPGVTELAAAAGVSERTLYRLFRSAFGMGPHEYALRLRMAAFRAALARFEGMGMGRGAVTRAAVEAGFTHFGRFSQQYREVFGETPRQTLLRWRRHDGLQLDNSGDRFVPVSRPVRPEFPALALG